jgi:hypothetical protein
MNGITIKTSFSGGGSRSIRREPLTICMGKQMVNFITCDFESSAPFFVIYKAEGIVKLYVLALNRGMGFKRSFQKDVA